MSTLRCSGQITAVYLARHFLTNPVKLNSILFQTKKDVWALVGLW